MRNLQSGELGLLCALLADLPASNMEIHPRIKRQETEFPNPVVRGPKTGTYLAAKNGAQTLEFIDSRLETNTNISIDIESSRLPVNPSLPSTTLPRALGATNLPILSRGSPSRGEGIRCRVVVKYASRNASHPLPHPHTTIHKTKATLPGPFLTRDFS